MFLMRYIMTLAGFYRPVFFMTKRKRLSARLYRIFDMDAIEATLDVAVRRVENDTLYH